MFVVIMKIIIFNFKFDVFCGLLIWKLFLWGRVPKFLTVTRVSNGNGNGNGKRIEKPDKDGDEDEW